MKVVTAADAKFKDIIGFWAAQVEDIGLTHQIYDLGGLGQGKPIDLSHLPNFDLFIQTGHYQQLGPEAYKSHGLHKPAIVRQAFEDAFNPLEDILYLDADAFLRGVPTGMSGQWDVCVTVRPTTEQKRTTEGKRSWIGLINAGVIWFNGSDAAKDFIDEWETRTLEEINDQRALNILCKNAKVGQVTTITLRNGTVVRLMGVPTEIYNNYYIQGAENACVIHLKNNEWQGKNQEQLLRRIRWTRYSEEYYLDDSEIDLLAYYNNYLVLDLFSQTIDENPDIIEDFVPNTIPEDPNESPETFPAPEDFTPNPNPEPFVVALSNNEPAPIDTRESYSSPEDFVPNNSPIDDPTPVSANGS